MDKELRKSVRNNLIRFAIGVVLLGMSYMYIQQNPAERVSILSGFEVMYQRVQIFVQKNFGEYGELLDKKYKLEKYYEELIKMAEERKCEDPNLIADIIKKENALKDEKRSNLENTLSGYMKDAYKYDNLIEEQCE